MTSRMQVKYKEEIVSALMERFKYKNIMEVPKLNKIVINIGLGSAKDNPKVLESALRDLEIISGQKPVITTAKKSIANFKLGDGMKIGTKVALPRVRDFRGVSASSFDGRGNYALGIKEQLIFPEIVYDMIDQIRGMDIIIVTTAKTDEESKALLELLGMPFKK